MKLIFAFGISFQLPVVLSLLARVGLVDSEFLKFLFSINFTEKIDNSYKISNGIAKPICVIGSGGVNKAAAANIITTTYFLLFFKNSDA